MNYANKNLSISNAIKSNSEYLSVLAKDSKQDVIKFIILHIEKLSQFVNIELKADIIRELSFMIYDKIYYYNIDELHTMFNFLKQQKYFSRTANEILINMDLFIELRFNEAEKIIQIKHSEKKSEVYNDDFVKKFYQYKKNNPLEKTEREKQNEDELKFQQFKADYERKKQNATKTKL